MHDGATLGGPVWLFAQFLILATIALAVFVAIDSLRPRRRSESRVPEPVWLYTALSAGYLALLVVVQLIPGFNLASAAASVVTPFALALCVAYLLRVVYPKPVEGDGPSEKA